MLWLGDGGVCILTLDVGEDGGLVEQPLAAPRASAMSITTGVEAIFVFNEFERLCVLCLGYFPPILPC